MRAPAPIRDLVDGRARCLPVGHLDSWKEIAAWLGRNVRTAQRWERARRLPVHRVPGGGRPTVFALTTELEDWLAIAGSAERETDHEGVASIAVLPFEDMSQSAVYQFFSDALADEIINVLADARGISVIARTSSFALRGQNLGVRDIGRALGVGHVLEGAVELDGTRATVRYQLVDVKRGFTICSGRFERAWGDRLALEHEIAAAIATQALHFLNEGHEPPRGAWAR